jgi:hypothetical protein
LAQLGLGNGTSRVSVGRPEAGAKLAASSGVDSRPGAAGEGPSVIENESCELYWGRSRAFWTRIVLAVIGALTMIVAAWLGRS